MADEAMVEVLDVGLVDRVIRSRSWAAEQENGRVITRGQSQQHPIPEVYMAALEAHIGDAQAKVTVGAELSHNRDYCKAQAFVSVTVTCNNKEEDISAVHNIIHPLARKLVAEDLEKMKLDRDGHIGAATPSQGKISSPPRANAKPVEVHQFPPKGKPEARPGVPRPSFRR